MADQNLQSLVDEALLIKKKIKSIDNQVLKDLKELLKKLSGQILTELKRTKATGVVGIGGSIVIQTRKGSVKMDVDRLIHDFNIQDIEDYEKRGKKAEFLKYNLDM